MKPLQQITVIGVGLIGGSFAKAVKEKKLAQKVIGFGHNPERIQKAVQLGVIDEGVCDLKAAVENSDLIMLAVPLGSFAQIFKDIKPYVRPDAIITDAGSAKLSVVNSIKDAFGEIPRRFVAGHPIAGKEQSGVEAADSDLFIDHRVILTPTEETDSDALECVETLWRKLGALVEKMSPQFHDEVFAATSHLPHLLAFALVEMLNEHPELGNVFKYTAGGFRDFTRIASSDAVMWRDISVHNHTAIAKWLQEYRDYLDEMIKLIEKQDAAALHELFLAAKTARDTHIVARTDAQ
ncbi:prephenate dehydrogenase [Thiomicrorhabdus heinhorstiae]|uniref:Prephenate dehydrogenase/arogenate dehydrogenase family protein n=1 Tax=Thiomicrorhabdus heinhorstiae TaxID=2748010 RepID=A0ABS0BST5_9GAMM|nr:prephenate dehydrogenase/arogenate dehydrogenase family protein [Thiomicrorhabdus heinhorstiae]MBF6056908.1 prephenate dehydrogenase/arogenate dehydrogenase family protein [Thiomicrorhabdus heinhorstiae]